LRQRLARRQQEKAEIERQLHAVQRRYQEEVAPLKEKVLRLQMERLRQAAQRHMRSARHRNAYHDAQRAYETFQEERSRPEVVASDELKRRYREASKRCHPDVVPPAYRAQAAATFQALESAYQAGHVRAVRAIADALERWGFPGASSGTSDEAVTRDPDDLRQAIADLESAISSLRKQEAYQAAKETDDVDALLRARKEQLLEHLRAMQEESLR
jgi:hypothetical protein